MDLLTKITADYWTGEEILAEGDILLLSQSLALRVEKEGYGYILNKEAIEEDPPEEDPPEEDPPEEDPPEEGVFGMDAGGSA